jgi:FlaA1/EpsC-like NDP-sugar epimerase
MRNIFRKRNVRRATLFLLDLILINLAAIAALKVGFDFETTEQFFFYRDILIRHIPVYSVLILGIYYLFGLYSSLWEYASIKEMISILGASIFGVFLVYTVFTISSIELTSNFYVINTLFLLVSSGGVRFSYRLGRVYKIYRLHKSSQFLSNKCSRVLIIGAGDSGTMTAKEIENYPELNKIIIGFLDDDESKIGVKIIGIPVLAEIKSVGAIVEDLGIDEIIISIPSLSSKRKREVFDFCKFLDVKLKTVPSLYDLIDGKIEIEQIRNVEIEDLLGRDPVKIDNPEIAEYIENKVALVTGGGGSIGSELCRQVAAFKPKLLIVFDIYENNAYSIQNELKRLHGDSLNLKVLIGSVRDEERLKEVFEKYRPEVVFHAAAHKHVPLMQDSPFEAIKNNSIGTYCTADTAGVYGTKRFVFISTDKAVNPTNVMGASKRLAEIAIQRLNEKYSETEFMAVRFGNVLGSNGSVIPLFKDQIKNGGPVRVTHPDIIRYFMTIPEAVQLVLQAGSMSTGGEIFVLDMGDPVKILELAKDLIRLSGFEPYEEISIEFVGLRPGEKLFEELLLNEEGIKDTIHEKIFVIKPVNLETRQIDEVMKLIRNAIKNRDIIELEKQIEILIPKYQKITDEKLDLKKEEREKNDRHTLPCSS